jgi:uncharacterized protein (TIGR02246 family)
MKRPWAIVFLLFAAIMSTARADAQDEKAAVTDIFKGYARAWDSLDMQRILPYYNEPLILITAAGVRSLATRADIEAWVKTIFARITEGGYARGEYSQLHVKQMSPGVAMASGLYVRYKTDGQELERLGATYVLHKTGDGWKIAVFVGHDPGSVLKID